MRRPGGGLLVFELVHITERIEGVAIARIGVGLHAGLAPMRVGVRNPRRRPLAALPGAELVRVPAAGHSPAVETPEAVGAALDAFLRRH